MVDLSISIYDLEFFLLVFTRISCFIYISPFFGMKGIPGQVKVAISFFTSVVLYETLSPAEAVIYENLAEYAIVVAKEAVTGLIIGFGANICTSIVNFTGTIADMETGLSMVTLFDPATNENTSVTGAFYQYSMMLLLVATGMYRYLLGAIADTFKLIPVNGAVFDSGRLVDNMISFMGDYIIIGFRIVLPIFCVILLLNALLGVLAKVSPQMNMFSVGMQLKIIVGLSVMFLTVSLLQGASDMIFTEMKDMISGFVESMR